MKVLIVQFWPRYETALEIAQDHLDAGDQVVFMTCMADMPSCWLNLDHSLSWCGKCMNTRKQALSLLDPRLRAISFLNLTDNDRRELENLPRRFSSLEELKAYRIEDYDIGMAIASGIISAIRDPELDVTQYDDWIRRLLISNLSVYRSLQNYLRTHSIARVYVANARGCETRAVFRACLSRHVDCFVHEGGRDKDHYELWHNAMPHDYTHSLKLIKDHWHNGCDIRNREQIGAQWYQRRAAGADPDLESWLKQEVGKLPAEFDRTKHNVVIFNSSEDEFAAISEDFRNPLYHHQAEGLAKIRRDVERLPKNVHFYLRVHPFLTTVKARSASVLSTLAGPRFCVIDPGDKVSSYALMQQCQTVLTFGSTAGIEATFWGKPSILAGLSFYRELGGTYNPQSHEELVDLLGRPLEPKPREAALMYGYYFMTLGKPFKHYRPIHGFPLQTFFSADGTFKGRRVAVRALTHYFWAAIHRLSPLNRFLNARHRRRAFARLGLPTLDVGDNACRSVCKRNGNESSVVELQKETHHLS